MPQTPSAQQVRALRDAGDLEAALRLSCLAWRCTRAPQIAAVIEALAGPVLDRFETAPKQRTKAAFHKAWIALAADSDQDDPVATGWLISTFHRKLPEPANYRILDDNYDVENSAILQRIEALKKRAPDPRVAAGLLSHIELGTWSVYDSRGPVLYKAVLAAVVAIADPRCIALLGEYAVAPPARSATTREYLTRLLGDWSDKLAAPAPTQTALADVAEWQALAPRTHAPDPRGQQLLAAIYTEPTNDELRLIYADLLQGTGDPHGEFIALQMADSRGALRKPDQRRVRALLKDHKSQWLGDLLSTTLSGVEFERGFPARGSLRNNAVTEPESWAAASADPRLATFVRLSKGQCNWAHYTAFVTAPACAHLVWIDAYNKTFLQQVMMLDVPRPHKVLNLGGLSKATSYLAQVAASPVFQSLTTLAIAPRSVAKLFDSLRATGLLSRLQTLRVLDQQDPTAVLARWPDLPCTLQILSAESSEHGQCTITRAEPTSQLTISGSFDERATEISAALKGAVNYSV